MDLLTLLLSFVFGVMTILAPCVLPLLPVIIGGSLQDRNPWRPWIITGSLTVSIVLFTILLKTTSLAFAVEAQTWKNISGGIVILFGLTFLFPLTWQKIAHKGGFGQSSETLLQKANTKSGILGMVLTGAALGPVFTSCSPTYGLIIAIILPQSFLVGTLYLLSYALGLALIMGIIAFFGQKAIGKMRWASNPQGWFKRILGILFLLVGLAIIQGYDKKIEAFLIERGWYIDTTQLENEGLERIKKNIQE